MPKSYVSQDVHVCPVCGQHHAVGVLFDRRLRDTLEKETVTGYGLCPEHEKLNQDGFIALIVTTDKPEDGKSLGINAARTGDIAHIQRRVLVAMTNLTAEAVAGPMMYIDQAFFEHLQELDRGAVDDSTTESE